MVLLASENRIDLALSCLGTQYVIDFGSSFSYNLNGGPALQ